jgi:hypothetical protein
MGILVKEFNFNFDILKKGFLQIFEMTQKESKIWSKK